MEVLRALGLMVCAAVVCAAGSTSLDGLVLAVDIEQQRMIVSHKEIPGVMPAMAMPVRVAGKKLRELRPGMSVRFELVTSGGKSEARHLTILRADNSIEQDGKRVPLAAPSGKLAIGQEPPELPLMDQRGRPFLWNELRGKVVAVQFLYTRCPMPEVCPRLAATFAALQRRFAMRMGKDVELVSITLDPVHDTAAELSRYAEIWRGGGHWRFLTGSEEQIKAAAASFGLVYWPEEGVITHTSTVGILGRDGKLAALVEGLSFTARQLGDLIESEAGKR
jgi:protein SCO1/2